MVTTAPNLAYFLNEMERQYPKAGPEAARLRRRIAEAAARGARRGRRRMQPIVRLATVGLALATLACLLAGQPTIAGALARMTGLPH